MRLHATREPRILTAEGPDVALPCTHDWAAGRLVGGSLRVAMTSLDQQLQLVRAGAAAGARTVCQQRQAIDDAISQAVEQWEKACMQARPIGDWFAWARRVGSHAAKRAAKRDRVVLLDARLRDPVSAQFGGIAADERECLLAMLADRGRCLRGRQFDVVMKLIEPQMSIHRAAKELGMARFCVRRSFRSALQRFRAGSVPPRPSSC